MTDVIQMGSFATLAEPSPIHSPADSASTALS